jgi:UrcA family protein
MTPNKRRVGRRKGANMSKLVLAAAAALVLAGPVLAAQPAAVEEAPTQVVSAKGVNFNDPVQVRHFYARLQGAARAVCGGTAANADMSCVRRNVQEAVKAVDAPKLTAMLDATYGPGAERSTAFAADAR